MANADIVGAPLTAREITELLEVQLDRYSAEETLKIALSHYHNSLNQIQMREKSWWDAAAGARGIDLFSGSYHAELRAAVPAIHRREAN